MAKIDVQIQDIRDMMQKGMEAEADKIKGFTTVELTAIKSSWERQLKEVVTDISDIKRILEKSDKKYDRLMNTIDILINDYYGSEKLGEIGTKKKVNMLWEDRIKLVAIITVVGLIAPFLKDIIFNIISAFTK